MKKKIPLWSSIAILLLAFTAIGFAQEESMMFEDIQIMEEQQSSVPQELQQFGDTYGIPQDVLEASVRQDFGPASNHVEHFLMSTWNFDKVLTGKRLGNIWSGNVIAENAIESYSFGGFWDYGPYQAWWGYFHDGTFTGGAWFGGYVYNGQAWLVPLNDPYNPEKVLYVQVHRGFV